VVVPPSIHCHWSDCPFSISSIRHVPKAYKSTKCCRTIETTDRWLKVGKHSKVVYAVYLHICLARCLLFVSVTLSICQCKVAAVTRLPRILVIYFPQYHPDPINDKNWGINFTDWSSLKAAPAKNRLGFKIPRPNELGYYDLRDTAVRKQQGNLARDYGIDGFIMHHYWFYDPSHPGSNLHAPLMEMLKDGEPNIPFCLNWCAVKWTNVWMGGTVFSKGKKISANKAEIIQDQFFNATDEMVMAHYKWLKPFFRHANYIRVNGEPVFVVYSWDDRMMSILQRLRDFAIQDGFPGLYLIVGRSDSHADLLPIEDGELNANTLRNRKLRTQPLDLFPVGTLFNKSLCYPYPLSWIQKPLSVPEWCGKKMGRPANNPREEIPGIAVTFDNTPRRDYKNSLIWNVDHPDKVVERFNKSLNAALYFDSCCHEDNGPKKMDQRFVVINAWNEWAEGMSLEPSDVYGRRFLEVVRDAKQKTKKDGCTIKP
jgi:hypothetical protein